MAMARLTQDRRRGMTPPGAPGVEADPFTPGTGAHVYIRPHGRGARPQQHPKCQAEELSARCGGKQSKGGKTWPHSAGQTRTSPHAYLTNVPDRLGPNPSTPRTIRLGNATAEPSPDGRWSYGYPTPARSTPHRQGKNPGIVAKRPVGLMPSTTT